MTEYKQLEQVLHAAEGGATVITSNTRAARNLRRAYAERQLAAKLTAWQSPEILPWSAWLRRLWQEHCFHSGKQLVLLDEYQERLVWEKIVAEERRPLDAAALAQQCVRAWKLLHAFQIPLEQAPFRKKQDTSTYWRWMEKYRSRCEKNEWMDDARLPNAVLGTALQLPAAIRLIFWGFDSLSPQQETFVAALQKNGLECSFAVLDREAACPQRIGLEDTRTELRTSALWARNILENEPEASVGIVVPNLEDVRAIVEHIFLEVLHPDAVTIERSERRRAFDISLGLPIAQAPVVAAALLLLQIASQPQSLETVSRVLRSPFIGDQEELAGRAALDVYIRTKGVSELSLGTLESFANKRSGYPRFANDLRRFKNAVAKLNGKLAPSAWSREIPELLEVAGWPGSRGANSAEFQARRAFVDLLSKFAKLDAVSEPAQFPATVRRLSQMAEDTTFQPENLGAPVQIVGLLEAAGSEFDHLWLVGMHSGVWPPEANPSPLLPIDVQRNYRTTGSSTGERLEYAKAITGRLLRSAPRIVVSYPTRELDVDLEVSPLFEQYPPMERTGIPADEKANLQRVLFAAREAESEMDSQGPSVVEASSKGGTRIFQLQAACPFRAFAELRLGAKELELPSPGLDRRTRGKLLHGALESVWKELKDSSGLRSRDEVELEELAKRSVASAISDSDTALLSGWEKRVAEIEQERLVALISQLLELEKQRPADFKIKELEQKKQFTLGGVTADVKVDRVDELQDGRLVLLDYKSGEPSVKGWEGERPDEPQLPLYATRLAGELSAVAFVQLNSEGIAFKGYAREEDLLPGMRKFETTNDSRKSGLSFDELLKAWDETLERLGQEFRAGHSKVDPKARKTCDLCHLGMLCRINEAPLAPEEEENGNE